MYQVTVVKLKKIEGNETLAAFADVAVGEITINGIRLMKEPKGGHWLGFPQTFFTDKSGKKKYVPIIEMSEGLKKLVKEEIEKDYNKN